MRKHLNSNCSCGGDASWESKTTASSSSSSSSAAAAAAVSSY